MSGQYTQEELLLLSNYVYIPASTSEGPISQILDRYRAADGTFTEESVLEAARGGGMSCADVKCVFSRMDARIAQNPAFGNLSVSRKLEEHDVRALCFTDEKDKNPVVAFRGTGGTREAWSDNFEGAYEEDTRIQKVAGDFIKNECGIYSGMVVTGHSKGGNLAQYVTVKNKDMVSRCISFDGQGFGDDFIKNNEEDIREVSSRICSISAYNDFVNILLTGIAATTVYVTNSSSAADAHSPVSLLTENSFDDKGDIVSTRRQGPLAASLDHITERICSMLSPLEKKDKEVLGNIAGSTIALALSTPPDRLVEGCVAPTMGMIAASVMLKIGEEAKLAVGGTPLCAHSVYMDTAVCTDAAMRLKEQSEELEKIKRRIDAVRQNMAYTVNSRIYAENALEKACYDLSSTESDINSLSDVIERAGLSYEKTEEEAYALIEGQH